MRPSRRAWAVLALATIGFLAVPAGGAAEAGTEPEDAWKKEVGAGRFGPLAWLEGEWQGYGRFPDRTNYIRTTFEYDLGGMYLVERNVAMFPPPEPSTEYEIHQDVSIYYRDTTTGGFAAKSFYIEGFVSSSTVEVLEDGSVIVIESTSVENGPPGMRARSTISRETEDRFLLTFEIAMPGKDYSVYEDIVLSRVR